MNQPTLKESLELIRRVCSLYQGNLQEHNAIQQALAVIEDSAVKKDVEKPKKV